MNPIVAEVARRGRVSFRDFMELALYHPDAGYYTKPRPATGPVGPRGDFITAPTAAPLLADTVARLLARLAAACGEPVVFAELAAGEGFFLERLCASTRAAGRDALRRVVAVEIAPWARERLADRCPGAEVAAALSDVDAAGGPVVLFASELYDALPVHRVTVARREGELVLLEYYVEAAPEGGLAWALGEPSRPEVAAYLHEHGIVIEEGQLDQVRPQARAVHEELLSWCGTNAVCLVIDYGYPAHRLYNPRGRRHGSLVGYRDHRAALDVLQSPGETDITAHVNFDDLEGAAAEVGWKRGEVHPLGAFLAMLGATELLPGAVSRGEPLSAQEWAALAEAKRIMAPSGMGTDLKVLVQGCGRLYRAFGKIAAPPPLEA